MRRLELLRRLGAVALTAGLLLAPLPSYAGPPEGDGGDGSNGEGGTAEDAGPPEDADAPPADGDQPAGEGEGEGEGGAPPDGEDGQPAAEGGEGDGTEGEPPDVAPEQPPTEAEGPDPAETQAGEDDEDVDMSDARAAFAKAAKYYELGEYGEAIVIFENLFEKTANIALLFNIGQSYWRRFNVDPNVAYLRKAKQMFENYNTRSAADDPEYSSREVDRYIAAIDAQILGVEAADRASLQPVGPTKADREFEQRTTINKTLIVTGTVMIVLGSAAALLGLAGGVTRAGTGFSLDQNGGRDNGSPNLLSPGENEQLRSAYLLGGQLAFAGLLSGGILLPVGITLSVVGNRRQKAQIQELAVAPGSLLTVSF